MVLGEKHALGGAKNPIWNMSLMLFWRSEHTMGRIVILSKRFLRGEGSGRSARGVAFFATQ